MVRLSAVNFKDMKYLIGKKEFNLIQGKDGLFEAWYGKGRKIVYEGGEAKWTGGIHRIITPCKTEQDTIDYIGKLFYQKKDAEEKLPVINFPKE